MERKTIIKIAAKPNSAVALQPCPLGHITADKREIKDFPKPSPLSRKRGLKGRNILISAFGGLEVKSKCIEGWASFIRNTLYE